MNKKEITDVISNHDVVIIGVDGKVSKLKSRQGELDLKTMQKVVGGYVELIPNYVLPGYEIYANEDGEHLNLELNIVASILIDITLLGPVLIVKKGMVL